MKPISSLLFTLALAGAPTLASAQQLGTGIDKNNMDLTVSPANDFYQFCTGGWQKAHPLTPEFSRFAQFDALNENNTQRLQKLIEDIASKKAEPGTLEQKIGALYRLAMDSTRRNAEDYNPIRPTLDEIEALSTRRDVSYEMAQLSARGVSTFFGFYCDADIKDAKWNLMQVSQGGLSMDERDYYLSDDEATKKIREAYRDYVRKLFTMTGASDEEATRRMEAVLTIETRLAKASKSAVELRDNEANYHKMSYRQLLADYPGIDWSTLFLLNGVPTFENISVGQPEAIHEVERVLAEASVEDLKAYLYYKVVDDAASSLSDRFRAEAFGFYSHVMRGAEQDRPRWKRAVGSVESVLGMAVGKMYVEKYFPEQSKQRMLQLVKNLQVALGERIDAQKWMSAATKEKAHEKLNAFRVKIGYPDEWMDYSGLTIDEEKSYYENMVAASQFMSAYYIKKRVNKPTDPTEWLMTPQTINAYYNPTTNEICFPAGILQPPFFNPEADDACNYGAIGVVIGHEMTHGFDDQGALFDKDGNLSNWWTEEDKKQFDARTKVMSDYFSTLEVQPGVAVNGALTLGENIADHGGLNIAFQALQNAMKQTPLKTEDNFTPAQRFFISYGTIWALNIRPEAQRQLIKVDPHAPGNLRVNGALPHINAWYEAFGVTKKSPLFVPKAKRVDVW